MEIEVAVVVIIHIAPAITNGTMPSISTGKGRNSFKVSVPEKSSVPDKTHPMIGPIIVLVT